MISNINYRYWQFIQSLKSSPGENDWLKIGGILSENELALFKKLPTPDQNHSLRVLQTLELENEIDPDLIKAALLHDLGKIRYPLRRWERIFAVLVKTIFPKRYHQWGAGDPSGLKRPLVVINQHSDWGADLAQQAGSSLTTVWLIRNHESTLDSGSQNNHDLILLNKLQKADNQN